MLGNKSIGFAFVPKREDLFDCFQHLTVVFCSILVKRMKNIRYQLVFKVKDYADLIK